MKRNDRGPSLARRHHASVTGARRFVRGTRALLALLVPVVGLGSVSPSALAAQAGRPGPAAIQQAVAEGQRGRSPEAYTSGPAAGGAAGAFCRAGAREGACAFSVVALGPLGRVQAASMAAAKRYLPFSIDSVADSLLAPVLEIRVTPEPPLVDRGRIVSSAPEAQHVVLVPVRGKREPAGAPIQPLGVTPFPVTWSNLLGGTREGVGVVATFALDAVPAEEFEIVVVTSGAESRYRVRGKQLEHLR